MARFVQRCVGLAVLVAGTATLSAQRTAAVRGVVRDVEGTPQMGVTVQLLTADARVVAAAFTDLNGRYQLHNLVPGIYQLRALATLSLPAVRPRLQLRPGELPTVNVTLSGLLDQHWLPAGQRRGNDEPDDWRWTLRSSANRPLLRVFDDDASARPNAAERSVAHPDIRRTLAVAQGQGSFGDSGTHLAVEERRSPGEHIALRSARADLVNVGSGQPAADLTAVFESKDKQQTVRRAAVRFESRPQVALADQRSGMAVLDVAIAQQFMVGDFARVEAGSLVRALRLGQTVVVAYPFVRVETQVPGGWFAGYAMATSAECQGVRDVGRSESSVPAAGMIGGRLRPEQGRHQAVSLRRKVGRGSIDATLEHNALRNVGTTGAGLQGAAPALLLGRMTDGSNGTFRELHDGFSADGWRVLVAYPVTSSIRVEGEYGGGAALAIHPGVVQRASGEMLTRQQGQSVRVGIDTTVHRTGTRLSAGYAWQPTSFATSISPFTAESDGNYLNVHLRQSLHVGHMLPPDTVLSLDGTNLARQGYFVLASVEGAPATVLASTLRALQATLSFTF